MTDKIPTDVVKYAESPIFTETTVPQKLTKLHGTKPGVWGRLCVLSGSIKYVIPGPPLQSTVIEQGGFGLIKPAESHHVELLGPVNFKIEFYK